MAQFACEISLPSPKVKVRSAVWGYLQDGWGQDNHTAFMGYSLQWP